MAGKFLQGAVSRGLREAGAVLREEGGIEVRCPFVARIAFYAVDYLCSCKHDSPDHNIPKSYFSLASLASLG